MADSLSSERREEVWEALSEAFVDNEVDYGRIADQVAGIDSGELEAIFFTEVAPHCGPNLMSPVPPVWTGFDRRELADGIRAMQQRSQNSVFAQLRHKGFVAYCRWYFRAEWKMIAAALAKR